MTDAAQFLPEYISAKRKNILVLLGAGVEYGDQVDANKWLRHPIELQKNYKQELDAYPLQNDRLASIEAWVWDMYEMARFYTSRINIPKFYYALGCLAFTGKLKYLISLNYTRYLDNFFDISRDKLRVRRNPLLSKGEHLYDGYYSYKKYPRASKLNDIPTLEYWKIHGDLGYASFVECHSKPGIPCRFKLPPFPVSDRILNIKNFIIDSVHLNQFHDPIQAIGAKGIFQQSEVEHKATRIQHHIDWHDDPSRQAFQREIDGACERIVGQIDNNNCLIWIIGFTGQYNTGPSARKQRNEELVPAIIKKLRNNKFLCKNMFITLHEKQYRATKKKNFEANPLIEILRKEGRLHIINGWDDLADDLYQMLGETESLDSAYKTWVRTWVR